MEALRDKGADHRVDGGDRSARARGRRRLPGVDRHALRQREGPDPGHQVEGALRPPGGGNRPLRGHRQRPRRHLGEARLIPMDLQLAIVVLLVGLALVFDYINGFHDAANSIATVVSTRVLSPGQAVVWAAFFNFVAAFAFGTAVAKTVGAGHGRPQRRHLRRHRRRAARRDRLEPDHLVLRAADQLVARALRRLRRRRGGQGRLRQHHRRRLDEDARLHRRRAAHRPRHRARR